MISIKGLFPITINHCWNFDPGQPVYYRCTHDVYSITEICVATTTPEIRSILLQVYCRMYSVQMANCDYLARLKCIRHTQ